MTRPPRARLLDILASCEVIAGHLRRADADEVLLFDALRIRLVEIGEAAKDLPADLTDTEPALALAVRRMLSASDNPTAG